MDEDETGVAEIRNEMVESLGNLAFHPIHHYPHIKFKMRSGRFDALL